jgi:hypothetical protein
MSKVLMRIIQLILAIIIAALAYVLYHSIKDPYKAIERQEELTELTRGRMEHIRTGLTRFYELNERFPLTLDTLVTFVQEDSLLVARPDSFFTMTPYYPDSLPFLPRDPERSFEYAVNDTSRIKIYFLKDPDTDDTIGALTPDITMVHAASWE